MQRAPRTPESYFNVPESITLLNIVKSDRIQNAFQSNRKNHASVWDMVANILSRYNDRKRSAKQCCNRYENLKKIYTQLKRNPEKHVRRNWPYMYLFREIEEQRGESWGSSSKRNHLLQQNLLNLNNDIKIDPQLNNINNINNNINSKTLSYYQKRRAINMLMKTENLVSNIKNDNFILRPTNFVETELNDNTEGNDCNENNINNNKNFNENVDQSLSNILNNKQNGVIKNSTTKIDGQQITTTTIPRPESTTNSLHSEHFNLDNFIHIKEEFPDQRFEQDDDEHFIHSNYNGHQEIYMNGNHNSNTNDNERNILHPDVIVDTDDHITDGSSISIRSLKRKLSTATSSDGDSTNYELIEYLKRREKRDQDMFKRMEKREERLIGLLERTVVAIERIASHININNNNNNTISNNNNNSNSNKSNHV